MCARLVVFILGGSLCHLAGKTRAEIERRESACVSGVGLFHIYGHMIAHARAQCTFRLWPTTDQCTRCNCTTTENCTKAKS